MKRFLKKLLLFIVPVLLFFVVTEYLLRKIPNDYQLKVALYEREAMNVETLILGNSYALYDLDPAYFTSSTFNGGHLAQSLDIDAAIFKKFSPTMTKLNCVIIPLSDVSFYFKLRNSEDSWRITNYSIYYKLPVSYNFSDYFEIFTLPFSINRNRLIAYYLNKKPSVTISDNGFGTNFKAAYKRDLATTSIESAKVHAISDFTNSQEEVQSLQQIIALCQQKNIRVMLFIPPAYHQYVATINKNQLMKTLATCQSFATQYKNVSFYNFLNDSTFLDEDYFDAVHLNEIGAKKMSLRIDSILQEKK